MQANQINAINYLLELYDRSIPPQDIQQYFKNFGLELVKDKNVMVNIITSGEKVFAQKTPLGEFESIRYNDSLFLNIKNERVFSVEPAIDGRPTFGITIDELAQYDLGAINYIKFN